MNQKNDNFIDKTFTVLADIILKVLPATKDEKQAFSYKNSQFSRKIRIFLKNSRILGNLKQNFSKSSRNRKVHLPSFILLFELFKMLFVHKKKTKSFLLLQKKLIISKPLLRFHRSLSH